MSVDKELIESELIDLYELCEEGSGVTKEDFAEEMAEIIGDAAFSAANRAYAEIKVEGNSAQTVISGAGTPVQVEVFDTNGLSNVDTPDHTEDHITVTNTGVYAITVFATINSVAGPASRLELMCKKNNGASSIIGHNDMDLGGGGAESSPIPLGGFGELSANDTVEVWIENETGTQNYVIEDMSLTILQIG